MNLLDPNLLAASIAITAVLFGLIAYFTRAGLRRTLATLVSAIPIVPLVMVYDAVAARIGWWRYPSVPAGSAPLAWYIAAALGYGAAFGLIGWRVIRRWGNPGMAGFVIAFGLFGVTRDFAYSATTGIIQFGPGPIPLLADFLSYASAALLVQLLMRWFVGPARSDPLARTSARR